MTVKTNAISAKRKELANDIAEWLGTPFTYSGAPTFAYKIGDITIDKNGTIEFPDTMDGEVCERLLEHLADTYEIDMSVPETEEPSVVTVQLLANDFTENAYLNLKNLVDSKAKLMKKAFGTENLPIERVNDTLAFPWFPGSATSEEIKAYAHFVHGLCEMAKTQQRITAKEREVENEKYAFRCFLLRLGFIGEEFKNERKILLRNLEGSSAFKSGSKKEVTE